MDPSFYKYIRNKSAPRWKLQSINQSTRQASKQTRCEQSIKIEPKYFHLLNPWNESIRSDATEDRKKQLNLEDLSDWYECQPNPHHEWSFHPLMPGFLDLFCSLSILLIVTIVPYWLLATVPIPVPVPVPVHPYTYKYLQKHFHSLDLSVIE